MLKREEEQRKRTGKEEKKITMTIGIEKLDDEFEVQIPEDITLEQLKNFLEKALGYKCNINISKYVRKKTRK